MKNPARMGAAGTSSGSPDQISLDESYNLCKKLAITHYENFPIGTWLLPAHVRSHFYAIYAFCRGVDDLGDEAAGDRDALLEEWEEQLRSCYSEGPLSNPYFPAIRETIRRFDIPLEPFTKLVEANRMDQKITRHATFDDLLHYCAHSANPVGRIVLCLFGIKDEERGQMSDCTCTALQLANFWQDVRRDFEKGRIYIPEEDMRRFGVSESDVARPSATDGFKELIRFEVERTRGLFEKGYGLLQKTPARLRVDLALFTMGGLNVLRAIEGQGFDVLTRRPKLSKTTFAVMFASALARSWLKLAPVPKSLFGPRQIENSGKHS